ncbi:MAG: hypothetical protein ABI723_23330 [Bacteroidia bacterium]
MRVKIPKKFTEKNLDEIVLEYWNSSLNCPLKETITFDLTEIEWIASEEITFLFGWIRHLISYNKKVYIELPSIYTANKKAKRRLISLWHYWKIYQFVEDFETGEKKKKYDLYFNVEDGINSIIEEQRQKDLKKELEDKTFNKILPFQALEVSKYGDLRNIDKVLKVEIDESFKLEKKVNELLQYFSSNTPFQNKTLSYIIAHELFLNVVHHAFPHIPNHFTECYFTVALTNKFDKEKIKQFENCNDKDAELRLKWKIENILPATYPIERLSETLDFFMDKTKNGVANKLYKNESYLEFTILDFGQGISKTLKESYENDISDSFKKEIIIDDVNFAHNDQNPGTKTLEYAFLLSSSRYAFDESLKIHETVPRGLYFLIDIVRRYNGMVLARSNSGRVTYDFSEDVLEIRDAVKYPSDSKQEIFFPGTMITILIPASTKGKVKINAVKTSYNLNYSNPSYELINVFSVYSESLHESKIDRNDPDFIFKSYYYFFKEFNNTLDKFRKKSCILYIDFAGFQIDIIAHKLLYYLCTTPKINEQTNAIILNFENKSLIRNVRESLLNSSNIKNKDPFIYRPIPCIFFDGDITWIGIKHEEDELLLDSLFRKQSDTKNISKFKEHEVIEGNIFLKDENGFVSSRLPSIEELKNNHTILNLIRENTVKRKNEIFLTAGGYYQNEFIALFECLHSEEIANLFGTYLIQKLKLRHSGKIPVFHKILSVTVSSQLIAYAIREYILNLKKENELPADYPIPRLISLASYYSFSTEKQFRTIDENEKIILVNDIISTGSLVNSILEKLELLNVEIVSVLTIADTRVFEIEKANEVESCKLKCEEKLVSLLTKQIRKYKTNLYNIPIVNRINPVLNAIVDMEAEKAEERKVLFKNCEEFISENKISDNYFKIGHVEHDTSHFSYWVRVTELFESTKGNEVVRNLKMKIDEHERTVIPQESKSRQKSRLTSFFQNINQLKLLDSKPENQILYVTIEKNLRSIEKTLNINKLELETFQPEYIFFPIFSAADKINKVQLSKIFGINLDKIFRLQRYETDKGWRFTFPPKLLNEPTRDKQVLILDSGSATGNTIFQLIDSICFLQVSKIVVLSVVGRIEDFQREFLSRIREMKVKHLKTKEEKEKENQTKGNSILEEDNEDRHIIPVHIYFGTQLHIPAYASYKSCPICKERDELIQTLLQRQSLPKLVEDYITFRIEEIQVVGSSETGKNVIRYLPIRKENLNEINYDLGSLFMLRDKIGKINSYRFYKDYFEFFNQLNEKPESEKNKMLELLIGIINHESYLLKTIEDLLPDTFKDLKSYIERIILSGDFKMDSLNYQWNKYGLVKFLSLINYDSFFSKDSLQRILEFIADDELSKQNLAFVLWNALSNDYIHTRIKAEKMIVQLWAVCKSNSSINYSEIVKQLIYVYPKRMGNSCADAFKNLLFFYLKEDSMEKHTELQDTLLNLFLDFKSQQNNSISELRKLINPLEYILNQIEDDLIANIKIIESFVLVKEKSKSDFGNFNKFVLVKSSLDNELNKLKEIFNTPEKVNTEKIISIKSLIANYISSIRKDFIHRNSEFALSCLNYNCSVINIWKEIVGEFLRNKSESDENKFAEIDFNLDSLNSINEEHCFINKNILSGIYREIIHNMAKEKKNDKMILEYEIRRNNNIKSEIYNFNIIQDRALASFPEKISEHQGGLKLIHDLMTDMGGEFTYKEYTSIDNRKFTNFSFDFQIN